MVPDTHEIPTDDMSVSHLAQFNALRDEIIKRAEFEHQLIALTLAAAGTLAAVGLTVDGSSLALLVYPVLTAFISIGWLFNNFRIQQMGYYIREKLEPAYSGLGWEQFLKSKASDKVRPGNTGLWRKWLSPQTLPIGIFCVSPLVFLILALPQLALCWPVPDPTCTNSPVATWTAVTLLITDFILILITTFVLHRFTARPQRNNRQTAPQKSTT